MSERPLSWWSASVRNAAARQLDPAWQQWCRRWGLAPAPVGALNACDAPAALRNIEWTVSISGGASFAMTGGSATAGLRSLLFALEPAAARSAVSQPIACAVADAAWRDLQGTVTAGMGDEPSPRPSPASGRASKGTPWRAWSGALLMRLPFASAASCEALALFDDHAARRLCEPLRSPADAQQTRVSTPLAPILGALEAARLSIRVELDDIELDLGNLETLAIGDVIAIGHRLDERLHVCHAGAGPHERVEVCAALLGCRDGRRAVELVAGDLSK